MSGRWTLALAVGLLCLASPAAAQVRIGLAVPLSGADAPFGLGMRAGAEQAVADINRGGGILGQKVELVIEDDAGEPKQGAAVARKFVQNGLTLVVGHLDSGVSAAALPIYDEAGIIAVTPGATWSLLSARGGGTLFRLCGSDQQQAMVAATYLADRFGAKPIAFVHDKTSFGRGLVDEAAKIIRARGGKEGLFEGVTRGDKDFSALVARMKAAKVGAVYFGGLYSEAALLIRAMREAGITAPLVGSDGLLDKDFSVLGGPGVEGTLMTFAPDPPKLPEVKNRPRPPEAEMFASRAYAAIELIKAGVEGARTLDGRQVAAHLHAKGPFATMLGNVAFDARGDLAKAPYGVYLWRKTPDGRIDYAGNER